MTVFRLGELYCGPGGLACGAGMAYSWDGRHRIEHAWASDYDADTCKTYARNICHGNDSTVYCEDVRKLDLLLEYIVLIYLVCTILQRFLICVEDKFFIENSNRK